ncbi:glutamyl-tRNA reductase [Psittacicella hinzii]|uniref:Glutamyl-tRNA reductase n=1 Tax=Psittacicella hinzii TaxID=2028575 RepID=A0A3A1YHE0_9GAMM|nr:glutamyl-tRNA reductase [Psittacicella hinzii]RIY36480.1 glutamyl-tRNA reductase [Psittacicella hinzii]
MSYFIIGSNYQLADTSFSSKVAFSADKMTQLHHDLLINNLADCALIISTCNRSEVFIYKRKVDNLEHWINSIQQAIINIHQLETSDLAKFYQKLNQEACLHLFKVACGLDSLVLGEPQITGQIKDAMNFTEQFYASGNLKIPAEFYKLIDEVFACAKEVRTHTAIGKYAVSIAYMACKIARSVLPVNAAKQPIVLIGASQTNLLLARHLLRNNLNNLIIVNRSFANAQNFVHELGTGQAYTLEQLPAVLEQSSLVFSSTSAQDFIVTNKLMQEVQAKRNYQDCLLFDLAIPNDIDPAVVNIQGVKLFNRDNLQHMVEENKQKRSSAIDDSLPIIYRYLERYSAHNRILQGNDIIVEYRNAINQHRKNLVEEAKHALGKGEDIEQVLENLSISLTNKILHTPTLMLSSLIKNGQTCQLADLSTYLDRRDKDTIQEVITDTLNKDIFKQTCCKDKSVQFSDCKIRNQSTPLTYHNAKSTIPVNSIKATGDTSKCPFHQQAYAQQKDLATQNFDKTKGVFIPLDYQMLENQLLNDLVQIIEQKSEATDEYNEDLGIGLVKFKKKRI